MRYLFIIAVFFFRTVPDSHTVAEKAVSKLVTLFSLYRLCQCFRRLQGRLRDLFCRLKETRRPQLSVSIRFMDKNVMPPPQFFHGFFQPFNGNFTGIQRTVAV